MRGCLSSMTFAILVDGNAKGWIKAYRGRRQGDPLSYFLFTMVVDVLSRLVVREEERGLFEGFLMGKNRIKASHLQFVDDTISLSKASLEELQSLKPICWCLGRLLGLRINLNMSTLSGININQDQTVRLASLLNYAISYWPLMYLGLPLGWNPNRSPFGIQCWIASLEGWMDGKKSSCL